MTAPVKRTLLSAALLLLLAFGVPLSYAQEDFTLITATDLHFISPELTDGGAYFTAMIESADGKMTHYSAEIADAFVAQVIRRKPDALVLTGDLTFNGAKQSHEELAAKLQPVLEAGIPVYVMPGNHDLNSRIAASFSGSGYTIVPSVNAGEFEAIYRDFGFSSAISRDANSLSYIAQLRPGLRLLMLDVNTPETPGAIRQSTLAWLWEEMAKAQRAGDKVIAASHQNLYAHSSLLSQGYVIANAQSLERVFSQHDVLINLSGHMHMQHTIRGEGITPEAATSSLSVSPCQYGVVTIGRNAGSYHTEITDVSAWAKENGVTDPNLLHFDVYADAFFRLLAQRQALASLGDRDDAQAMADCLTDINAAYFSGRLDTLSPDPDLIAGWVDTQSFFGLYIDSILKEIGIDHTRFTFPI